MRASLVDTSRWQGTVNVQAMADAGFAGIVARCTIGWAGLDLPGNSLYKDVQAQARAIPGFLFGAYHLLWASNRDPRREAIWYLQQRGDVDFNVLDVELDDRTKPNQGFPNLAGVQAQAKIWLDEVSRATQQKTVCYTGSWFWTAPAGWESQYDLWEAEYTVSIPRGGIDRSLQPEAPKQPKTTGWTAAKLWQWTSGGKPIGVTSQSLDYNVFMDGDVSALRSYLGLAPPPVPLEQRVSILEREAAARGWNLAP